MESVDIEQMLETDKQQLIKILRKLKSKNDSFKSPYSLARSLGPPWTEYDILRLLPELVQDGYIEVRHMFFGTRMHLGVRLK